MSGIDPAGSELPRAGPIPSSDADEKPHRLRHILCVDDDESVLRALCRILGRNFEVTTARGALEALQLVWERQPPFHVIISDLRMPAMNGFSVLEYVMDASPRTVRILLTGHPNAFAAMEAAGTAEVFRILEKPFRPDQLLSLVDEACMYHEANKQGAMGLDG